MSDIDLNKLSETEVRKILEIIKTNSPKVFEDSYAQYVKTVKLVNILTIYCEGFEVDTEIEQEKYDRLMKILAKDEVLVFEMPVNRPYGRHELSERCFEYQENVNADKIRVKDRAGEDLAATVLYAIDDYDGSLPDPSEKENPDGGDIDDDGDSDSDSDGDDGEDVEEKIVKKVKK